ncbi:MAG TPA: hypothetical protein VNT20_23380 [Flavisolibacter sp.]|jgi:hypothetical protein|nr:hypothetical protein [Flavisolibacter sp.]
MHFKSFRLVLLVIFCCSLSASFSQQKEGFKLFFEKVYLHLDRSYYAPGDDIWFKAYLVNAQNNLLLNTSNNLYVELIDPSASIMSRRVIRMDSIGVGDFHLGDSISGGTYRIRAYTNWMRNFGNRFVFEKEVYVTEIPQLTTAVAATKNANKKNNKVGVGDAAYKIQFLPEGGNMIEEMPTIVAFKAEHANGKGVDAKGYILSPNGDTAAKFKTTHLGMGSFAFTPKAQTTYKAFVQYGKSNFVEVQLPAALPTGYVMNVENSNADSILVTIKTNPATTKLYATGVINIAARHAGKSYFKQQVNLNDGQATVNMPKKDFPGGIAYITLYDENMRPNCERLVYIEKETGLHVELMPDKNVYKPREQATINILVTDEQHKPVKTALSFAAVENGADPMTSGNIVSYLMLESDLQGKIENAYQYFDKKNPERLQQLDLLLRTQGWRSFLWRQIADTTIRISYLPEAGVTISGEVLKPFTNKTMNDMNITLFAPEAKGDKIYLTKTNAQGKYYLDGLPLYGIQNIRLNVGDGGAGKRVGELKMDTLFANPLAVTPQTFYSIDSSSFNSFEKLATMRWSKFRNNQWPHMLPNVTIKTRGATLLRDGEALVNFGYPEYNLSITNDDYQYPRLRDFLVQKIPGARYDDDLEGVYFLSNGKPTRPILFVNGQQDVFNRLDYYSLSLKQIERVNVRHMVGSPTYGGIGNIGNELDVENFRLPPGINDYYLVSLVVKPGNANQQLSKISASVNGYYDARIFYVPNYSKENPVEEDERITIHWAPFIKTDENGKVRISFYNADPKTKIKLNVQGLTSTGIPVFATGSYDVK